MAGWINLGEDRWRHDFDDRHVLLRAGTRLVEQHIGVVHLYDGPETDCGRR
jgi:hypothetical protein